MDDAVSSSQSHSIIECHWRNRTISGRTELIFARRRTVFPFRRRACSLILNLLQWSVSHQVTAEVDNGHICFWYENNSATSVFLRRQSTHSWENSEQSFQRSDSWIWDFDVSLCGDVANRHSLFILIGTPGCLAHYVSISMKNYFYGHLSSSSVFRTLSTTLSWQTSRVYIIRTNKYTMVCVFVLLMRKPFALYDISTSLNDSFRGRFLNAQQSRPLNVLHVVDYIDTDCEEQSHDCAPNQDVFIRLLNYLNVSLSARYIISPSNCFSVLLKNLQTSRQRLWLKKIRQIMKRSWVLGHDCRVLPPGG